MFAASLLLLACTGPEVARERVQIPALRAALDVPLGTGVELEADGASFSGGQRQRSARTFEDHARPSAPGELREALADDVSIAYTLRRDDGGSGGSVETLTGSLRVGGTDHAVECVDQGEWPDEPDAAWCLPWLATLRVER